MFYCMFYFTCDRSFRDMDTENSARTFGYAPACCYFSSYAFNYNLFFLEAGDSAAVNAPAVANPD